LLEESQPLPPHEPLEAATAALSGDHLPPAFKALARVDSPVEVDYYRHGGILPAVLRRLATTPTAAAETASVEA